ncbi:hypothetical protein BVY02_00550 [bacterium J17]|nr:hypothetical protein BVY02_00550 [bacterium J17]
MDRFSYTKAGFSSQAGMSQLGMLFTVLVFGVATFLGYQILPFYYYSEELRGFMESQARNASGFSDDDIRKVLLAKIDELKIPIDDKDDLKINRINGHIVIDLEYEEVLAVDLGEDKYYELHVFQFNPHVEQKI